MVLPLLVSQVRMVGVSLWLFCELVVEPVQDLALRKSQYLAESRIAAEMVEEVPLLSVLAHWRWSASDPRTS